MSDTNAPASPVNLNDPLKPHIQAALFGLPDINLSAIKNIDLSSKEIEAIITIIGLILRQVGIPGLSDFLGFLLRMQQTLAVASSAAATTVTSAPAPATPSK